MNWTSLITLPIRLGYEATRRTLDVATAAGRLVGLVGAEKPAAPVRARRRPRRRKRGMDDATLARKVETEIFRGRRAAKGKIDVNTAGGVVWLRGEAKTPQQIKQFEAKAAAVPEVKRVENLLHLPKTPAPSRTDTPASQRKTRRGSERTAARQRAARSRASGRRAGAPAPPERASEPDDVTLTRKVETEIFREGYAPKGSVNVNTVEGVVWLRGQVKAPAEILELERRTLAIPGVKRVENLLHLAGDEAPTQIAGTAPEAEERPLTRRFTTEERTPEGEPLPKELADRGEGRQPAPLGASDDAPGGGGGGDARTAIP